ncbi:MAG TPA: hypothetical protein VFQ00_07080 [Terriglobales bacterium]|nr:hypothetical protein [Terriglobales bacterium]
MRRSTPELLILLLLLGLSVPCALASVPDTKANSTVKPIPELQIHAAFSVEQLLGDPADTHAFANEFYMQELSPDSSQTNVPQQHSSFFSLRPVTAAAADLSKTFASWRHVLARLMP